MLVPVRWLKEYIDIDADVRDISNKVTDSGSHVESIKKYEKLTNLIVALVLEIKNHPNSEKLSIIKLDLGDRKEEFVTGAKNMKVGDKVVLATLGAKLSGGKIIEEAEFKGVKSLGMLCSYEELGVSEACVPKGSQEGVIILGEDAKVGEDAVKLLDLDDDIIEFEITPNRPDCLSIIGMAREVAAVYNKKLKYPDLDVKNSVEDYFDYFRGVELNTDKVSRFMTAVVKNIVIKDSPIYIQNYLRNAGMRPINNIVDFTNFVMLEYGQPMHAYDLDTIKGNKLIVRNAIETEKVITIDQSERKLVDEDIIICDGNSHPIGIAGIMGGFSTEVTQNTKNILIESANFNSESIRKTSKRLGLRSESSSRFEKGISPKTCELAIKRFLRLIELTNSGEVVNEIDDQGNYEFIPNKINLRVSRVNQLLGVELKTSEIVDFLEALELEVVEKDECLEVLIPYFREDLTIEADLIEEIGRLYGFHNITPKPLVGSLTKGIKSKLRNCEDKVRNEIYSLGFSEVMTYSFISKKQFDKLNVNENSTLRDAVEIINPLGEDFSIMRTTLIGNMLDVIRKNLNNKQSDLRFSEVGNIFKKSNDVFVENKVLTVALVGNYDYYYLKDILDKLLKKLNVSKYKYRKEQNNEIFHSGRCAEIKINDEILGYIGEINPIVLDNFDIQKRVYLFEINLNILNSYRVDLVQYKHISRFPLVERDIAFIVDKDVQSQDIIDNIIGNAGEYLVFAKLFDMYEGNQIAEDKVSLAYKLGFQSNDFTLKDEIVKEAFNNVVEGLKAKFNIDLRG